VGADFTLQDVEAAGAMLSEIRSNLSNPYRHINFIDPNCVYNIDTLSTFGRFAGTRGHFQRGHQPHALD
jgi:hypothetical protein